LQKLSDAPLTECPSCAQASFQKQVTAAGFQLKGSGWYATDFKGNGSAPSTPVAPVAGATDAPSGSAPVATETAGTKADTVAPAAAPATKPTPASS
jgi:hypothetical protein